MHGIDQQSHRIQRRFRPNAVPQIEYVCAAAPVFQHVLRLRDDRFAIGEPSIVNCTIAPGSPPPLIASSLVSRYRSATPIAIFIFACAIISLAATAMLKDNTNKDISDDGR